MPASEAPSYRPLLGRAGIITGALGGIGKALAQGFVNAGARVALLDLEGEKVKEAADSLGPTARGFEANIANEHDVDQAFEAVADMFGRIDFLVNNAGVRLERPFLEHSLAEWQCTLDVNLTGTFLCARSAARYMVEQGRGKILNIASIAASSAVAGRAAYVASKAGVVGLTRAIAWELGDRGIFCNALLPGVIQTPLTSHYFDDENFSRAISSATALKRPGTPADLIGPALFLCSPASDYVQGAALPVDGGWLTGKGY